VASVVRPLSVSARINVQVRYPRTAPVLAAVPPCRETIAVEQFGAGGGSERVETLLKSALEFVGCHHVPGLGRLLGDGVDGVLEESARRAMWWASRSPHRVSPVYALGAPYGGGDGA
jgi:hypothetical protein